MPVQVTYPGVYIQELPSGRHTITGVATSITAFVGRALYGPVEEPITIFSFGDYQRFFGGLAYDFPMSYAVQDFFLNGGSQAVIVRLFEPKTTLTLDEWNTNANNAAQVVKKAASGVKTAADNNNTTASNNPAGAAGEVGTLSGDGGNTTPKSVVEAVQDVANNQTDEPGKTVAQSLLKIAQNAAGKSGATPDSVKATIDFAIAFNDIDPVKKAQANNAAQAVKQAAYGVTGEDKKATDVVTAVQGEADKHTEEPGKTVAQILLKIASDASGKSGATADDVKTAIDDAITNNTYTTPPYPTATLTLNLLSTTDGKPSEQVIKDALSPIQGAIDALFDTDGNTEAKNLTDKIGATHPDIKGAVKILTDAAQSAVSTISDSNTKKIAQQVASKVTGNSLQDALDAAIQALAKDEILNELKLFPEVKNILKTILIGSSSSANDSPASGFQAALDSIFDTDGNKFNPTKPTVDNLNTEIQKINNQFIKDAATKAQGVSGQTVKGLFDAVLAAIPLAAATAVPAEKTLILEAANPGTWGTQLKASVNTQGITDKVAENLASYGLNKNDLFNLTVQITYPNGTTDFEQFTNVTIKTTTPPSPNRLDLVLNHESQLLRVPLDAKNQPQLPSITPPGGATSQVAGGDNGKNLSVETYTGDQDQRTGIYALEKIELFNIMCIPPDQRIAENNIDPLVYTEALSYCFERRAMLIVDPPTTWLGEVKNGNISQLQPTQVGIEGPETINAAVYFPRVIKEDPMMKNQLDTFSACGIIAGIYAATDVTRGVWKAPAGLDAGILGINSLELKLTDQQNGVLNPLGINCLRTFPIVGSVVWGDRTLRGADILDSDYKYVSVRRLTLYIEESLYQGTKWAVFEPNNENLWSALRLSVGSFMESLSRQGAFYSYQVVCDKTTTTQRDIDLGIVNVLVQFAPVKPAEFVVIQIQQQAGQTT
ncbi:phage tail sheath C-terminal domain-containing protein [Microcystis sp. T1-4]|uniref:phage tail sheath C-terminal domain-containing protein n=1 Tax=Microcystis sp. T1-4 TaxID=1160279 RepID=UPI000262047A|nr:phage tail sheath C-terminal domain-containing protein [Microcystis sp. T1-4]CCI31237.1 putative phage tail sheath protein (modular protein) [Microcystis sp. T1-4]